MKLYYSPGACSRAVHIMLREMDIPFTLVPVDLADHSLPDGSDFTSVNPKGKVPTLVANDGSVHTEVVALLHDLPHLAGMNIAAPGRQLEWLGYLATELHAGYGPLFDSATPADYRPVAQAKVKAELAYLDRYLSQHDFLAGTAFSAADAYLFVLSGWTDFVDIDRTPFAAIEAFRQRVAQRPSVIATLAAETK